MSGTDDEQAAYFALLRAREGLTNLQRFEEYITAERVRIDAFISAGQSLDEAVDHRLRRTLRHTDDALNEALELRRRVLADEKHRLPLKMEAAQEHIDACDAAHTALRA
jgi:hypothetical protein